MRKGVDCGSLANKCSHPLLKRVVNGRYRERIKGHCQSVRQTTPCGKYSSFASYRIMYRVLRFWGGNMGGMVFLHRRRSLAGWTTDRSCHMESILVRDMPTVCNLLAPKLRRCGDWCVLIGQTWWVWCRVCALPLECSSTYG